MLDKCTESKGHHCIIAYLTMNITNYEKTVFIFQSKFNLLQGLQVVPESQALENPLLKRHPFSEFPPISPVMHTAQAPLSKHLCVVSGQLPFCDPSPSPGVAPTII